MNIANILDPKPFRDRPAIPPLDGATGWLNTDALNPARLRGRVVLVGFGAHASISCIRTLPYLRRWATAYEPYGLTVVRVHSPEPVVETHQKHVRRAAQTFGANDPVALDDHHAISRAFSNRYCPALCPADTGGRLRDRHLRFRVRDLGLDLVACSPPSDDLGHIRVLRDGAPPGDDHGLDIGGDDMGTLDEPRLHQLMRQRGPVRSRAFRIEPRDAGAAALPVHLRLRLLSRSRKGMPCGQS